MLKHAELGLGWAGLVLGCCHFLAIFRARCASYRKLLYFKDVDQETLQKLIAAMEATALQVQRRAKGKQAETQISTRAHVNTKKHAASYCT